MSKPLISRDPEVMGGTPVFAGTRVPVRILTDHLLENVTLHYFLDQYPSVSREQAEGFLELVKSATETGDMQNDTVNRAPDIMSGAPVFRGTRLLVAVLIDHLLENYTLDYFLDHFPTVSREQAERFLALAGDTLAAGREEPVLENENGEPA